ncbi:unnamed protein product [Vicia faba]|uniref:Uncharacterized protein n=1 Tax=Vicia faba TaxID=3906 RepID=A0AAV1AR71_VICFA|nr:unnamed protein product [Vicia faba]
MSFDFYFIQSLPTKRKKQTISQIKETRRGGSLATNPSVLINNLENNIITKHHKLNRALHRCSQPTFNRPSSMPPQDPTNLESNGDNCTCNSVGANIDESPPFRTEQQRHRRSTIKTATIRPSPLQIQRQP